MFSRNSKHLSFRLKYLPARIVSRKNILKTLTHLKSADLKIKYLFLLVVFELMKCLERLLVRKFL